MSTRTYQSAFLVERLLLELVEGDPVDAILRAHSLVDSSNSESPKSDREALIRGAVILLGAQLEAFVETVFESAAKSIYPTLVGSELDELLNQTSRRFHNPKPSAIDALFLNLGIARITREVAWQGMPNSRVRAELSELVDARHALAHGNSSRLNKSVHTFPVRKDQVRRWKRIVESFETRFCEVLESKIADRASVDRISSAP